MPPGKRALALTLCAGALGHWTIDESRHARESLPWAVYYNATYYEIWIRALESLLDRKLATTGAERHALARAWQRAARATPHGQPVRLENDPDPGPLCP